MTMNDSLHEYYKSKYPGLKPTDFKGKRRTFEERVRDKKKDIKALQGMVSPESFKLVIAETVFDLAQTEEGDILFCALDELGITIG